MINGKIAVWLGVSMIWKSVAVFSQSTNNKAPDIKTPVRIALLPGLSSAGKNDKYTTSNFSLNVLGGSTGGINGLELGTLFNINIKNMQGVQAAGYFNITHGDVNGIQMAGWFNGVKGNLTGIQYGGTVNYVKKDTRGLQTAGIFNQTSGSLIGAQAGGIANCTWQSVKGMQMAGIGNINNGSLKGLQIAGIGNINNGHMNGVQISSILNYTKHLNGLQVGLINIADTSNGFSIGLINIVRKGYYKITVSTNEVLNTNLAIKSGNAKLYNILMVAINAGNDEKIFSYGYGIGHEIKAAKWLTINPEITSQYLYLGNWNYTNQLSKCQVLATVKLTKGIALFGGPSFAAYYSDQPAAEKGYRYSIPGDNYHTFELWNDKVTGWIGWTAGISLL
jgi:hypothetical protein